MQITICISPIFVENHLWSDDLKSETKALTPTKTFSPEKHETQEPQTVPDNMSFFSEPKNSEPIFKTELKSLRPIHLKSTHTYPIRWRSPSRLCVISVRVWGSKAPQCWLQTRTWEFNPNPGSDPWNIVLLYERSPAHTINVSCMKLTLRSAWFTVVQLFSLSLPSHSTLQTSAFRFRCIWNANAA